MKYQRHRQEGDLLRTLVAAMLLALLLSSTPLAAWAAPPKPYLVKDINTETESSDPQNLTLLKSKLYCQELGPGMTCLKP